MAQNLFRRLVAHLGYCCPWAFVDSWSGQTGKIAKWLGVNQSTVCDWKRRYKNRTISCEQCEGCALTPLAKHRRKVR
jgi:hypothetical protein